MTRVFLSQSVSEELNIKLKDWFVEKSDGSVFVSFKTENVYCLFVLSVWKDLIVYVMETVKNCGVSVRLYLITIHLGSRP